MQFFILLLFSCFTSVYAETFPSVVPIEKPSYELSAAMERLYDQWNPHEDLNNELYSNFKYTPLRVLRRFHLPPVVIRQKLLK